MMISRNSLKTIEAYLLGKLSPMNQFLFEVKLAIDPMLRREFSLQKKVFQLVKMYHRERQKEELEGLHEAIFNDPGKSEFAKSIHQIFE